MARALITTFAFTRRLVTAVAVFGSVLNVLVDGIFLGLFSDISTDKLTEKIYEARAHEYMDPLYLDSGFTFWERLAIERHFPRSGRVLVGAAGAGRELIAFAKSGYEVDGFDCSKSLVAAGAVALSARNIRGRLDWAPPCQVPLTDQTYDAFVVGLTAYSYITPRSRRVAFLTRLRSLAPKGTPILLSCFLRTPDARKPVWTPRIANFVLRCRLRPPRFEEGATFPGLPRHDFVRSQIHSELLDAGFALVEFLPMLGYGAVIAIAE